jgi:hypothetical protein
LDGDLGMQDLNTDVADWVENQLRTLGSLACQPDVAEEDASAMLARVGYNLFEQFLPKTPQEMCWTFRERGIKKILTYGGMFTADASALRMEDGDFRVAELSTRIVGAMRGATPLIFFNTCHSGRIGFSPHTPQLMGCPTGGVGLWRVRGDPLAGYRSGGLCVRPILLRAHVRGTAHQRGHVGGQASRARVFSE